MKGGAKTTARALVAELRECGDPEIAEHSLRFFKTGKGEYGEGDHFVGVRVPKLRAMAKSHYRDLSVDQVAQLLQSKLHEARLLAVIVWTLQFKAADETGKKEIYRRYLQSTSYVNNWDIVDASAHKIVGPLLEQKSVEKTARKLLRSKELWERRIAMMSTYHEIKQGRCDLALEFAEALLGDNEDLMHKSSGWMLREVGKKNIKQLHAFLDRHAARMPRTMLRYAIEKLPQTKRKTYLSRTA